MIAHIAELTGAALITRGVYVEPRKQPPPGERKLYLLIEGAYTRGAHYTVATAYKNTLYKNKHSIRTILAGTAVVLIDSVGCTRLALQFCVVLLESRRQPPPGVRKLYLLIEGTLHNIRFVLLFALWMMVGAKEAAAPRRAHAAPAH